MKFEVNISRKQVYATILILSLIVNIALMLDISASTPVPPYTLNAPPVSAYDAIVGIYSNGTYFWEKSDWQSWYNSATANDTINNAVGNSTSVLIKTGYYSSVNIKLLNNRPVSITGEGINSTWLDAGTGANAKVFEVVNSGVYQAWGKEITISNLGVMAKNGYGIYQNITGHGQIAGDIVYPAFILNNVNFGMDATTDGTVKYGVYADCAFHWDWHNIKMRLTDSVNAVGMWFVNYIANWDAGNSQFYNIMIQNGASGQDGILLDATHSTGTLNLMDFYNTEVSQSTSGIRLLANDANQGNIKWIQFYGVRLEGNVKAITMEGRATDDGLYRGSINDITMNLEYIESTSGDAILLTGYDFNNIVFNGGQIVGGTTYFLNSSIGRISYGQTIAGVTFNGVSTSGSLLTNAYQVVKFNDCPDFITDRSFSGANTTATTAVINHGLKAAATYIWVSFSSSAITGYTWTSNSTAITITPTGTLPASWTCYVKAEYKP